MPESENQIRISFDRKKMKEKLFTAIGLMAFGILYIFMPQKNSTQLLSTGCIFIFFSFLLAFYSLKRLTRKKPGFLIDQEGIHDYSGVFPIGPILWRDIEKIRVINIFWQKVIIVVLHNPQAFIDKQKNWFTKLTMSFNHIFINSPVCINALELNISINDLFKQLDSNLKRR